MTFAEEIVAEALAHVAEALAHVAETLAHAKRREALRQYRHAQDPLDDACATLVARVRVLNVVRDGRHLMNAEGAES